MLAQNSLNEGLIRHGNELPLCVDGNRKLNHQLRNSQIFLAPRNWFDSFHNFYYMTSHFETIQ